MIKNIDLTEYEDRRIKNNAPTMPKHNFRCIISGASGSGKTMLMLNMVLKYLNFDKVHIFSTSLNQSSYKMMKEKFAELDDLRNEIVEKFNRRHKRVQMQKPEPIADFHDSLEGFDLDSLDEKLQHLIIIDDMLLENQKPITELYVRSRHKCCSVMYLSQSYYGVPKTIRQNATCVILFNPTSKRELTLLYRDLGVAGIELRDFVKRMEDALSEQYSFVKLDTACKDRKMRYSKGFTEPLNI